MEQLYDFVSNEAPLFVTRGVLCSPVCSRLHKRMYSFQSRERTGTFSDDLTMKIEHITHLLPKLEEYAQVVGATSAKLQNVSRLLSSGIETVVNTVLASASERLRKTSQETVELLEEKRFVCEKLKQEGQKVGVHL